MKVKEDELGNDGAGGKDSSLADQGISTNKRKEKGNDEENKNDQNGKNKGQGKKARLRIVGAQFINGGEAMQMPILNSSNPDDLQAQLANFLKM